MVGDAAVKADHPTPDCGGRFAVEGQSMTDPNSILGKSEHEYLGWKIRTTNTAVESKFSARIEVWKPEHDPRSHNGMAVGFLKRAASSVEAQDAALQRAKQWIDEEVS